MSTTEQHDRDGFLPSYNRNQAFDSGRAFSDALFELLLEAVGRDTHRLRWLIM
jgi:hypothetical protein